MPLLNYTTKISPDRSAAEIQKMLAAAGAEAIMLTFENGGELAGLRFVIPTEYGKQAFTLPVDAKKVEHVLQRQKIDRRYTTPKHAHSVAWRITKDWLEAQIAIIQTEMVTLDQVMLPYLETGSGSLYEAVRNQQLALPGADS